MHFWFMVVQDLSKAERRRVTWKLCVNYVFVQGAYRFGVTCWGYSVGEHLTEGGLWDEQ